MGKPACRRNQKSFGHLKLYYFARNHTGTISQVGSFVLTPGTCCFTQQSWGMALAGHTDVTCVPSSYLAPPPRWSAVFQAAVCISSSWAAVCITSSRPPQGRTAVVHPLLCRCQHFPPSCSLRWGFSKHPQLSGRDQSQHSVLKASRQASLTALCVAGTGLRATRLLGDTCMLQTPRTDSERFRPLP